MSTAQPNIRFTTTDDGVAIGFWEIGSGPTLLLAQNRSLSHAELEWAVPSMARLYLTLARYFRLVRFDPRGSGISGEPPPEGVTHQGLAADIAAVADALGDERISLVGAVSLGPAAVQYAVDHPEQVERLVLCDTGPRLASLPLETYVRATDALVDLGVVPSLAALFPGTPTADLPALERLMRGSLYERPAARPRDLRHFDVTEILSLVKSPTLVVKSQDSAYTDLAETKALLAGIPSAEMRVVPGTMAPWLADLDSVIDAFVSFLTGRHHRPDTDGSEGLLTVVFTDLVSSTEVLTRLGDRQARGTFRQVEELITELSTRHAGRVVKNLGDGSLVTFKSTRQAIAFALELQRRMSDHPIGMRVGMAAGEPIQEDGDVHGSVVVQASRIADLAQPGDVIVSDTVRQLALGMEFAFTSRGEIRLKGFDEPQRIWSAAPAEQEAVTPATD